MADGVADYSGQELGVARLQFSDDGIPTVVEMVENEMVLDHKSLLEFLARAGGSYTIQGDDSIQPGTLLQISPNTILAVAAVDNGQTEEGMVMESPSIILPSEEGVTDDTDAVVEENIEATSAAEQQLVEGTAVTVGIQIASENMSDVDFKTFLCDNEVSGTSAIVSVSEPSAQQEHLGMEEEQPSEKLPQDNQEADNETVILRQGLEVMSMPDQGVTDVIQKALLADVDEDENTTLDQNSSHSEAATQHILADEGDHHMVQHTNETQLEPPSQEEQQNVVVIDVTNPIQLSQNSLIVVNGQKCVLQQDPGTGQVVAYPVKEPEKPKRRRGRPRKAPPQGTEEGGTSESLEAPKPPEDEAQEEEEEDALHKLGNGMVEVVTEDGALVRRSCRRRKKARTMKDYETNLKLNDESDDALEEEEDLDEEAVLDSIPRKRGRGRPPRRGGHQGSDLFNPFSKNTGGVRRKRGRPRRDTPQRPTMQAFLVQMADGQTLMMQIPTASLPSGVDLRDVAQSIAGTLNATAAPNVQAEEPTIPAVEGDTTTLDVSSAAEASSTDQQLPQKEVQTTLPGMPQCTQQQLLQLDSILPPQSVILSMDNSTVGNLLFTSQLGAAAVPDVAGGTADAPVKRRPGRPRKTPLQPQPLVPILPSDTDPTNDSTDVHQNLQLSDQSLSKTTDVQETPAGPTDVELPVGNTDSPLESSRSLVPSTLADAVAQVLGPDEDDGPHEEHVAVTGDDVATEGLPAMAVDSATEAVQENAEAPIENQADMQVSESQDAMPEATRTACKPPAGPATVIPVPNKLVSLLMPLPKIGLKSTDADLQKLQCRICEFQAYYPKQYKDHISTHEDAVQKCKCCNFVCLEEEELYAHYKEQHPRCICPYCNHTAEQTYIIKRHMFRHMESGCKCDICGKKYKDQYILKMHVKMVHMPADVLFGCTVCNKKFTRKAHLKRHVRTHNPDKPFKCHLCNYRGCERSDITKHMLIHEDPKHSCDICGRSFRHIKNKELHLKRHKGQKDYKCGVCEFYGYTFTDIRKHIERKHSDPRTILCDRCGQAFKTQALMKEHQMSAQCEVYMIEQELTEYDPSIIQLTEPAEEGADSQPAASDAEDQEVATIELTDESLATLTGGLTGIGEGQQLFIRKVDGIEGQYAIVTTKENGEQEITYVSEEALGMQTSKEGEEESSMVEASEITIQEAVLETDLQRENNVTLVAQNGIDGFILN
ncbi:uncharacterized protein LOC135400893 [Ornithodoros turicata]